VFVAQTQTIPPPYINYQAVLYDVNGANPNSPLTNQSFSTFVNINDELGNLLYREEHYASTDANGLITVKMGDGLYTAGPITNFNLINWGVGKYYLVVDFDINGTISSTAPEQLVTVPYSFYAGKSGNGVSTITSNGNQTLTITYDNGTTYTTQALVGFEGPQGPTGAQGATGQSAYDLWLSQGNAGTVDDFLNASAYEIWLAQGNTGTQQDFLNTLVGPQGPAGIQGAIGPQGPTGADGNGIASTSDNGDGTFTFTYDDGSTFTTSNLTGPQGATGAQGPAGNDGATGPQGPQGAQGAQGPAGVAGPQGPAGAAGNGIASTTDNGDGTFTFTYDDGSTFTTSNLTGPQGAQGPTGINGANGASAYDIWLAQGNSGSVQDFLNSLNSNPVGSELQSLSNLFTNGSFTVTDFLLDREGSILFYGILNGTTSFYDTIVSGTNNFMLAKIDSNLNFNWIRTFNTAANSSNVGHLLAVDTLNNIFVLANSRLKKFNQYGVLVFDNVTSGSFGYGLGVDKEQNIFTFTGTVNMFTNINGSGSINKYSNSGGLIWTYSLTNIHTGYDLVLDTLNNVYVGYDVATYYAGNIGQGIRKVSSSGVLLWVMSTNCNGTNIQCPGRKKFGLATKLNGDLFVLNSNLYGFIKLGEVSGNMLALSSSNGNPSLVSLGSSFNDPSLNISTNQLFSFDFANTNGAIGTVLKRHISSISSYEIFSNSAPSLNNPFISFDSNGKAYIILKGGSESLPPALGASFVFSIPGNTNLLLIKLNQ
jgi:hypothetical protein